MTASVLLVLNYKFFQTTDLLLAYINVLELKECSFIKSIIIRKYILKSCAPEFDGSIRRTTGEQVIRVKCDLINGLKVAFESSQHTTSLLVPDFDGHIKSPRTG
jgi:hypothetical protein